jgi:hypothetical protein
MNKEHSSGDFQNDTEKDGCSYMKKKPQAKQEGKIKTWFRRFMENLEKVRRDQARAGC